MENDKVQITIDATKAKSKLLNILIQLKNFYAKLNQELIFFWRKVLPKNEVGLLGGVFRFIRAMLNHPATALFINTVLFAIIGTIFGGLIERVLFVGAGLNIIVFCLEILGAEDSLKK